MHLLVDLVKGMLLPGSITFLVAGLVLGTVLLFVPRTMRLGQAWLALLSAGYLVLATPAGVVLLRRGLGPEYAPIQAIADARGARTVVLLGNGVVTYTNGRDVVGLLTRQTAWNVLEGARLYRLLDAPTLIVSGGIVAPGLQLRSEADLMAQELERLGVPRDHMVFDATSINTYEQSERMRTLVGPGRPMVVVTTPMHMPRTMALFHARGLEAIASPSGLDYRPGLAGNWPLLAPNPDSLWASRLALYEYLAFAHGWSRGWLSLADVPQ